MWNVWRWPVASNERAVANARVAATECARLRVERAETEQLLAEHAHRAVRSTAGTTAQAGAGGR